MELINKQPFIGLIGGGMWGKNLIREFANLNVLHTICDLDDSILESNKAKYPSINITKSWDYILKEQTITAVCVSLPVELHYKFCKSALQNNKNVFVEKPMALLDEHCDELIELARNNKKILMVGIYCNIIHVFKKYIN